MLSYRIAFSYSASDFEQICSDFVDKGYMPCGQPTIDSSPNRIVLAQAFILPGKKPPKKEPKYAGSRMMNMTCGHSAPIGCLGIEEGFDMMEYKGKKYLISGSGPGGMCNQCLEEFKARWKKEIDASSN